MSVWILTVQILILTPVLDEPAIRAAFSAIAKDEQNCDDAAKEAHKQLSGLGTVVTSCDLVKVGTPVERKRGATT